MPFVNRVVVYFFSYPFSYILPYAGDLCAKNENKKETKKVILTSYEDIKGPKKKKKKFIHYSESRGKKKSEFWYS